MIKYEPSLENQFILRDLGVAAEYGAVPTDRRVQVKMPSVVVQELDRLFPHIDRSQLLTKLALQAINERLHFYDRPDLGELVAAEQSGLNDMWDYLEERDAKAA